MTFALSWAGLASALPFLASLVIVVLNGSIRRIVWEDWLEVRLSQTVVPFDQHLSVARRVARRHELIPSGLLLGVGTAQLVVVEAGPTLALKIFGGSVVILFIVFAVILGSGSEDRQPVMESPGRSWRGSWLVGLLSLLGVVASFRVVGS